MTLQGKGFFIWKIRDCERGSPQDIAAAARAAGMTHVLIKVADGNYAYNVDSKTRIDQVPAVVEALRALGIQAWGWQYVYGSDPIGEARMAVRRIQQFNLDGFVIDAEAEYKQPGRAAAAKRYMSDLRKSCPNLPLALSSYRFPSFHPQLPWREFLDRCDFNMPQVYWEKAHNPAAQIARCTREFKSMTPNRPVFPTGPAYKVGGWRPSEADLHEFFDSSQKAGLAGVNFFSWDECRRDLPHLWQLIAARPWSEATKPPPGPLDIPEQWIAWLNQRNLEGIVNLYHSDAVHVDAIGTLQGHTPIRQWYERLLTRDLPEASFKIGPQTNKDGIRQVSWQAASSRGAVSDGSDTICIMDGKIAFHYTVFSIK
jgi:hypothetical protein